MWVLEKSTALPAFAISRARPAVLVSENRVAAPVAVVMVALPALVSLTNCRKVLLVMLALPAVLKKTNLMSPLLMMVTSPPPMPAPLKASEKVLGTVKVYAGAPALNANPPTVVLAENDSS